MGPIAVVLPVRSSLVSICGELIRSPQGAYDAVYTHGPRLLLHAFLAPFKVQTMLGRIFWPSFYSDFCRVLVCPTTLSSTPSPYRPPVILGRTLLVCARRSAGLVGRQAHGELFTRCRDKPGDVKPVSRGQKNSQGNAELTGRNSLILFRQLGYRTRLAGSARPISG